MKADGVPAYAAAGMTQARVPGVVRVKPDGRKVRQKVLWVRKNKEGGAE